MEKSVDIRCTICYTITIKRGKEADRWETETEGDHNGEKAESIGLKCWFNS